MKRQGSLFSNTVILGAAAALSKSAVFFLMPFYTAHLSPADFGVADILVSTALLLLPFVSLGAPDAVFRFLAGGDARDKACVVSSGVLFILLGTGVLALLLPLTRFSAILYAYRYYLLCYVLASLARSLLAHVARAEGRYGLYAAQQVLCALLTVLLQILFLTGLRLGAGGYLLGVILGDGTVFLCLLFLLRPWRYVSLSAVCRSKAGAMLRYALPLMPTAVLWWITSISDRYILLHYHGASVTGLYAAASRIPTALTFAIGVFMEAWQYTAISASVTDRAALYHRIYGLLLPVAVGGTAVVLAVSYPLVSVVYAQEYLLGVPFIPFLALSALCAALSSFLGSIYAVLLRSGASLLTAFCGAALNVMLNFLLIPRFGGVGAALATLLSYAAVFLVRLFHAGALLQLPRHLVRLSFSFAFLLLSAIAVLRGAYLVALLPAALSPLPFLLEIVEGAMLLKKRAALLRKKLREKLQKQQKTAN